MNERDLQAEVVRLLPSRKGHFRLEPGHHGDLWLDLELLCLRPEPVQRLAAHLAARLAAHQVEVVCGPLIEGAFVALMVASELGVPFTYAERFADRELADREFTPEATTRCTRCSTAFRALFVMWFAASAWPLLMMSSMQVRRFGEHLRT